MSSYALTNLQARLAGQPLFLSYQDAETYSKQLAGQLLDLLGPDGVRQSYYQAMPRGGLFVLGMLAYSLNLPHQALTPPDITQDKTLILVDDCALSGTRFNQFLTQLPDYQNIIFAHLASPLALREQIVARATAVSTCLAPLTLPDLARQQYPTVAAYDAWHTRWQQRNPQAHYWLGIPQLVIFPWNEPDRPTWNPETKQTENNWRLASPAHCLKNWGQLATPLAHPPPPQYQTPAHVAYSLQPDGAIWLYHHTTQDIYQLDGPSALIWRSLATYGAPAVTVATLQTHYPDVPQHQLQADVIQLAQTLCQQGLLIERPPPPEPTP